jgi:hypothetical protein
VIINPTLSFYFQGTYQAIKSSTFNYLCYHFTVEIIACKCHACGSAQTNTKPENANKSCRCNFPRTTETMSGPLPLGTQTHFLCSDYARSSTYWSLNDGMSPTANNVWCIELIDKCVGSKIWVVMKGDRGTSQE